MLPRARYILDITLVYTIDSTQTNLYMKHVFMDSGITH